MPEDRITTGPNAQLDCLDMDNFYLMEEKRALEKALLRYGQHEDGCLAWPAFPGYITGASQVGACTCGLTDSLKGVKR
jgi:hypothetical protein